ncbi:MAG: FAD-dependent monooxygenase [Acetobacteraceae bacterium]
MLWPRTLELLDIQGIVQGFLDAGLQGTGARIIANGHDLVHVSFDTARSQYRFTLFLSQSETERLLEEALAQHGVAVERQVELQSFADDGAGVTATLLHPGGRSETARFSYLLGCDGAHSTVRHGLGSTFRWPHRIVRLDAGGSPDRWRARPAGTDRLLAAGRHPGLLPDRRRPVPRHRRCRAGGCGGCAAADARRDPGADRCAGAGRAAGA